MRLPCRLSFKRTERHSDQVSASAHYLNIFFITQIAKKKRESTHTHKSRVSDYFLFGYIIISHEFGVNSSQLDLGPFYQMHMHEDGDVKH